MSAPSPRVEPDRERRAFTISSGRTRSPSAAAHPRRSDGGRSCGTDRLVEDLVRGEVAEGHQLVHPFSSTEPTFGFSSGTSLGAIVLNRLLLWERTSSS